MRAIIHTNSLKPWPLPDNSVDCIVTSPPYWRLRDYGFDEQIGMEQSHLGFIINMLAVFSEAKRVLKKSGTCFINIADSFATGGNGGGGSFATNRAAWKDRGRQTGWRSAPKGLKRKDMALIPFRLAIGLQDDGWYFRSDIIWFKPNAVPETAPDRPGRAHEYILFVTKSRNYYFDADSIREPAEWERWGKQTRVKERVGRASAIQEKTKEEIQAMAELKGMTRAKRSVWTIPTSGTKEDHDASYPEKLPEICIMAGCPKGGLVVDPFCGTGTTLAVAERLGRKAIGFDMNPEYHKISKRKTEQRYMEFLC